ncbi:MAG: DNA topoisomerase IV subunit B [Alphaproteobacteria bacterium]|nr:DNA topoisomerase IV subunit B [Alphaproteobacteria bacterium]
MDEETYTARAIKVLGSVEAIREHPAMFIGGTGSHGLHHLANELVDNAVDEALAGACTRVEVCVHADGSLSVDDDGRGIPVEPHPSNGRPAAEVVMTTLHAGAKFGQGAYSVSGGVHGVGLSCVCALAEHLVLDVWRGGRHWRQVYARGAPCGDLEDVGPADRTGTRVRFAPDAAVFERCEWSFAFLAHRLADLSGLLPRLALRLTDERTGEVRRWDTGSDLHALIAAMAGPSEPVHPEPLVLAGESDGIRVDAGLLWTDGRHGRVRAFTNAVFNAQGGTHERGFASGVVEALRDAGAAGFVEEDALEGLFAVVSVWVREPQFASQTKTRLATREAYGAVAAVVRAELGRALADAGLRTAVVERVAAAARGRIAATAARRVTHGHAAASLAGKLADCETGHPERSELFLVEGPSAGGSAKQARDARFQAVLPLRGKVRNAEQARLDQVLKDTELSAIVDALGCGVGERCDPEACRYARVVVMTDADPDGSHIRALLLTFFLRDLRPLVEAGRLFVARPPLYRASFGGEERYLLDAAALEALRAAHPEARVQRFKGLGEMTPDQLRASTMDPATRTLARVEIHDPARVDAVFHDLMGDDPAARRALVEAAWRV